MKRKFTMTVAHKVKSYDALVEALEAAVEVMEFAYMSAPKQPKEIANARAALKLAQGE